MQNNNTSTQPQILSPYPQAAPIQPAEPPKKFPVLTIVLGAIAFIGFCFGIVGFLLAMQEPECPTCPEQESDKDIDVAVIQKNLTENYSINTVTTMNGYSNYVIKNLDKFDDTAKFYVTLSERRNEIIKNDCKYIKSAAKYTCEVDYDYVNTAYQMLFGSINSATKTPDEDKLGIFKEVKYDKDYDRYSITISADKTGTHSLAVRVVSARENSDVAKSTVIFGGESVFSVYELTFIKEGSRYYLSTIRPLVKDVSTKL